MKNLLFILFIFFSSQNLFAQDSGSFLSNLDYPIEDVKYYYLSSDNILKDKPAIYTNVKKFVCDKSEYFSIGELSADLKNQFEDHLGDKKRISTKLFYYSSKREAQISHRRKINSGQTILDYSFKYYCME